MITISQIVVLVLWTVIGAYRYIEWRDENDHGVEPDLDGYTWYTILVNGPWWWLVRTCVLVSRFFGSLDWSWFERLFKIERKK